MMIGLIQFAVLSGLLPVISAHVELPGVESFVVPSSFPTSVFSSYYVKPAATSEPQPKIFDPVFNKTYPLNLTDPKTIPQVPGDPVFFPQPITDVSNATGQAFIDIAIAQVMAIVKDTSSGLSTPCSKCVAALVRILLSISKLLDFLQITAMFFFNVISLCNNLHRKVLSCLVEP